ncbi:PREDICTED: uncharacterized protein LOC105460075, partial [Wasmannia auropunctata]|uniref:uncharacterized protein LOC105460075 n=1 Tax=Wasmannia auropunctata TaxID=64793 RepID=UPI0005EF60F7
MSDDNANNTKEIRKDTNVPTDINIDTELNMSDSNRSKINDLPLNRTTDDKLNIKDMCLMNKGSHDNGQCSTLDIICDKPDPTAIKKIRGDTNISANTSIVDRECNILDCNINKINDLLLNSVTTSNTFNIKDMCIMNKRSHDNGQCSTTDIICNKSDPNAIKEIQKGDTNISADTSIDRECNISDCNTNKIN